MPFRRLGGVYGSGASVVSNVREAARICNRAIRKFANIGRACASVQNPRSDPFAEMILRFPSMKISLRALCLANSDAG
jgi:hypothetical protein